MAKNQLLRSYQTKGNSYCNNIHNLHKPTNASNSKYFPPVWGCGAAGEAAVEQLGLSSHWHGFSLRSFHKSSLKPGWLASSPTSMNTKSCSTALARTLDEDSTNFHSAAKDKNEALSITMYHLTNRVVALTTIYLNALVVTWRRG